MILLNNLLEDSKRNGTAMIEAIVLDFDDVVIETAANSANNIVKALEAYPPRNTLKYDIPPAQAFIDNYSPSWKEGFNKVMPTVDADDFKEYYDKIKYTLDPYSFVPGALRAVKEFKKIARYNGILTARKAPSFKGRAESLGFDYTSFNFYFTQENCPELKPSPLALQPVIAVLDAVGVDKENTVYIGDMPTDFQAANAAGLQFLGVQTGPRAKELDKYKDQMIGLVPSIAYAPDIIKKYNGDIECQIACSAK